MEKFSVQREKIEKRIADIDNEIKALQKERKQMVAELVKVNHEMLVEMANGNV